LSGRDSSEGMLIRPMSAIHRDAVIALWHEAGLTRPWNDSDTDLDSALEAPGTVLVALEGDSVLGTVMVGYDGHRGWLYYLAVATAMRRRGVGRELVAEAQVWLKAQGARKAQLMIRADNHQAQAFYSALGYETQSVDVVGIWLDPGAGPNTK
jgi:ribosomal protein S18 acetylase RimI-like enzyme